MKEAYATDRVCSLEDVLPNVIEDRAERFPDLVRK